MMVVFLPTITAQEGQHRVADSPFQGEFDYTVNTELRPTVAVDGVRWNRFAVMVKGGKDIATDKNMAVTVELDFVNTNPESVRVLVIALFEDAGGAPLDRVECNQVSVSSNRPKESVQKFKLSGAVLEATQRVYLYAEVVR